MRSVDRISSVRFTYLAMIVLGWTLYGVFFASQTYIRQYYFGGDPDWQRSLALWLTCAYSWAVLTPPILFLARRFTFTAGTLMRSLAAHVPFSIIFSIIALAIFTCFRIILAGDIYTFERFQNLVIDDIHSCVLVYFGILAVNFSFGYARRISQKQNLLHDVTQGQINTGGEAELQVVETPGDRPQFVERFAIKEKGRIIFVSVEAVDRITSDGNYVKLHTNSRSHLVRETMKALEQKLDPAVFVRVRRSAIVRIGLITELLPLFNGEFEIVLESGVRITSSRRYKKRLVSLMKS